VTTSPVACADAEQALGALVLGALDPVERDQVEAHVRSCPSCSLTLAELAPLAGLLHRVDLSADELGPPPPEILERALASLQTTESPVPPAAPAGARGRRWIPMVAGLAAAAVVVVAVGFGVHARLSPGEGSGTTVVASGTSSTTHVTASIAMTPNETGTVLDLTLSGVTPGEHCQLVAFSQDGKHEVASSWVANYEGEATVAGSTWLALADIDHLDITTAAGKTLLQVAAPA
jgi:hypothetical protein